MHWHIVCVGFLVSDEDDVCNYSYGETVQPVLSFPYFIISVVKIFKGETMSK